MYVWHCLSLIIMAATWQASWRVGYRWACRCGVSEKHSAAVLGCALPTAGLVLCVHLSGLASMLAGGGLYTPEAVAVLFVAFYLVAGRVVEWHGQRVPQTAQPEEARDRSARLSGWWLPIAVVVGMYMVFWCEALTRYPSGTDALHNHLPTAIRWMHSQAMDLVPNVTPESWPENAMIVPSLLSSVRIEKLLTFVHLPKGLLLIGAIYGLARIVGSSRYGAIAAACIAASVPMVVFQSFSGYVDLYGAASWLAGLLGLAWASRASNSAQRGGLLVIAGLFAGLALGSKATFLILTALLIPVAAAVEWIGRDSHSPGCGRPLRNAAVFGAAALVCSGFWYVRGTLQAGNPLYPAAVVVGGHEIFPGPFRAEENYAQRTLGTKVLHWSNYPWQEKKITTGYAYGVSNGFGAAYATFVPLGLVAAAFSVRTNGRGSVANRWRSIFMVMVIAGIVLLPTIFREMVRYVLPLVCLAAAVAALLLGRLLASSPRTTLATLTVALALTAGLATFKPVHSFLGRARDGRWSRAWYYQIPPLINELETGARILNLSDAALTYPLMGTGLRNDVISPIRWQALLAGLPISARALRENDVDYVFVRAPWPSDWPVGLPVVLIHDDMDTRVLRSTPAARIYRVLNEPDEVAGDLASITRGS